ncbi:unnamed protein product [Calypogeia fissa]
MDRCLSMCVAERHVFSSASLGSGRLGQDCCPRRPSVHQQRLAFETQLFDWSFQQCQTFFKNDLVDYVAALARKSGEPAPVAPALWTMSRGPRTYPGGARKWQWKRRQKEEIELDRERLMRERKIFATRRRQELRKTSPVVNLTSDNHSELSELMMRSSFRDVNLLNPWGPLGVAGVKDTTSGVGIPGKASEGTQVSEILQGGWTGSRTEVAEQIQKVRHMVVSKNRRLAGPSDNQTTSSFSKLPVSPSTLKALTFIMGIQNMTPLQDATFPIILQGHDLFARTNLAGEDTIASLIYGIELVLNRKEELPLTAIARIQHNMTVSGRFPITVLLVCPTQESASFLASEAKVLLMFHPGIRVQVLTGGNDIRKETESLRRLPCQIVIATPGRLLNHLRKSPELRGQHCDLKLFVLMEAQKLLEMGYRRTIERISLMISRVRQTLMWSSSQSDELLAFADSFLSKNHQVVDLRSTEEEGPHPMVRHDFVVVPVELHLALIFSLFTAHVEKEPQYKVVVFCQTVRTTTFMAETFRNLGFFTCELHMRKNDKQRERTAGVFRASKDGVILFTCGASVWGVTNPDVTCILQVGRPAGREEYVRRLTLTGRETKERECMLLLMPHEQQFLNELSDTPLRELAPPEWDSDTEAKVQDAVLQVDSLVKVKAYIAWLRYHVAKASSRSEKEEAVKLASIFCTVLGFKRPPQLNSRTIRTLGLKGIVDRTDTFQGE